MKLVWWLAAGALGTAAAVHASPAWVREAAAQQVGASLPPKLEAVVLLHEEQLTVHSDGRRSMRERGVLKLLQSGRKAPSAWRYYDAKTGRIRDFRAWILYPSGKESELPKTRVLDVALAGGELYDEARAKMIECDASATVGTVFAYEVTEEEDTIFTTYAHSFQESEPVLASRFILTLPAGWEARSTLFNHDLVNPVVTGNTYTWELHNLPWIESEPSRPGRHALAPRLGITYYPAAGARPELRPLPDWPAVSDWMSKLYDPPAAATDRIRAKAVELTAGAATEMDRVRAIAAFVQATNYVSIQLNVTHGGGYTPHSADSMLAKNYGDCKDKTTLMRALLKAVGIESYAVVIFSGDRRFVRPEWPTPMQFNHAIVAVKVAGEAKAPTIVEHPRLGRLLIFDPTDRYTPVGDMPGDEQASYALVIAGRNGDLVKMPQEPAEANRTETSVDASLEANGRLQARLTSRYFGQAGSRMRAAAREGQDEMKRRLERSISRRLPAVALDKVTTADGEGRLDLALEFQAQAFGQLMQNRLFIIKPGLLVPVHDYSFPAKERRWPVELEARVWKDAVTVATPPEFAVDELPDPVALTTPYGSYRANWRAVAGGVRFEQSLEVNEALTPAAEYGPLRAFFEQVSASQGAAVVLAR